MSFFSSNTKSFSLKLAPYIGDGNLVLIQYLHILIYQFETSPVYRGRKPVTFRGLLLSQETSQFETSPVYRGRKLLHYCYTHFLLKFETSPVYRGRKPTLYKHFIIMVFKFETSPVYRGRKLTIYAF